MDNFDNIAQYPMYFAPGCKLLQLQPQMVSDVYDYLRQLFGARNPASITTISFLDKASRHPESYKTDMCGFEIPDEFVVGYGLDYANYYRNLPYIGILKPECYK